MYAAKQFAVIFHEYALAFLLGVAILSLAGQLWWPAAVRWWHRPLPGSVGVGQFDSQSSLGRDYLLYLPDEGDEPWPLIVFLHGSGERGGDPNVLRNLGPFRYLRHSSLPAVVAAPQCPPASHWEPAAIVKLVDHLASQYNLDAERVYLVGYSMGGYGAWRVAATHPDRFAAIVPIAGGGDPESATALIKLPIWAFHGAMDDVVPVTESERMIDSVRAVGGSPRLTVLPEGAHGICHEVAERSDVWKWLLHQRRRVP